MKLNSSQTNNNNSNSSIRNQATSSSSIKVRKKKILLLKMKSLEAYKLFKESTQFTKQIGKNNNQKINNYLFIEKYLNKYNSNPFLYYIKITNQLLFNASNHLVSIFKENLIWNVSYDYIKSYFIIKKSKDLLPKIGYYYNTYSFFFPIYFPLEDLNDILSKNIKIKMKLLQITENDEDFTEEKKDIDKNIIDNNESKVKKKLEKMEKTQKQFHKESKDRKLINTTDIKTENSCSLSKYFGLDSIIKNKENSNYGSNNNFENQIINYSLLDKIKKSYKEKKENNLNFSLELASIIKTFEENEKDYYKNLKPKIKSCNNKKLKKLTNQLFSRQIKYKTNSNFYKHKYKNTKNNNIIDISFRDNHKVYKHPKAKVNKNLSTNKVNIPIILNNKKRKNKSELKKLEKKINGIIYEHCLTFHEEEKYNKSNNLNNDIINREKKINIQKKKNNSMPKKEICKNNITKLKSKKSKTFKIIICNNKYKNNDIRNNLKNNIYKIKNLSFNDSDKNNINKKADNIRIKIEDTLKKIKNNKNTRNRNDDIDICQSQRYCFQKDLFKLNTSKKIIVIKNKLYNNSVNFTKFKTQNMTLNSSYKESSS